MSFEGSDNHQRSSADTVNHCARWLWRVSSLKPLVAYSIRALLGAGVILTKLVSSVMAAEGYWRWARISIQERKVKIACNAIVCSSLKYCVLCCRIRIAIVCSYTSISEMEWNKISSRTESVLVWFKGKGRLDASVTAKRARCFGVHPA